MEITERIGDVQTKAATLHNIAIIYANKGDVDEAIALYNQSLEIFERIGDVKGKAATLHCLGLQPALEILQRLKSPNAESVSASIDRVIRNS